MQATFVVVVDVAVNRKPMSAFLVSANISIALKRRESDFLVESGLSSEKSRR